MILLKKLARDSLVHFLLIGILVYGAFGLFGGEFRGKGVRAITVTQGEVKALTDQWARVESHSHRVGARGNAAQLRAHSYPVPGSHCHGTR